MGRGKKKPEKPQAQSQQPVIDPDRFLVRGENLAWLASVMKKDSPLVPMLEIMQGKLKEVMKTLTEKDIPRDERATDLELKRAQDREELQGNPLQMVIHYGQIISDGARRRTKLCFNAFHECQAMMMETMIWAAMETARQNAKIMEAIVSRSKNAKTEIKNVVSQNVNVTSEVSKLAEQLAEVRAEVDNIKAKLDECNLRLSLIPPGYFKPRGCSLDRREGPRPSSGWRSGSMASESSFASNATSVANRIKQAQWVAWQLRGSLPSARTHSDSAASEMAHPEALSASSSFSRLPAFEPLQYPGSTGAYIPGLLGIPGIPGISGIPVLGAAASSSGCIGVALAFPEGRSRAPSAEQVLANLLG